jgi:RNA polymerase sigma factor (sigma-70 family)
MATAPSQRLTAHASRDRCHADVGNLSDEELLVEFLEVEAASSEEAFRAIVVRHGPMVMGVCRHALHHEHDAEDAFQAVFLTLARKADTIRNRRGLSGWLYEVAYRVAIRARANAARRRDQEGQGAAMSAEATTPEHENTVAWDELRPVLHDEVNRLPEKYRLPIILSYLEGKSNEEVAVQLEWPVGTVKGRLSRARDLLRTRLSRRGVALSAAFLCMALSQNNASAEAIPESLIDRTLRGVLHARSRAAAKVLASRADRSAISASESSRVEAYADLAHEDRRSKPRSRTGWLVLVAVLCVGFAIASGLFSDPLLTRRVKASFTSMVRGGYAAACH